MRVPKCGHHFSHIVLRSSSAYDQRLLVQVLRAERGILPVSARKSGAHSVRHREIRHDVNDDLRSYRENERNLLLKFFHNRQIKTSELVIFREKNYPLHVLSQNRVIAVTAVFTDMDNVDVYKTLRMNKQTKKVTNSPRSVAGVCRYPYWDRYFPY